MTATAKAILPVLLAITAADAADVVLQAIAVNGVDLPAPVNGLDVETGDTVTAAFLLGDWSPSRVRAYQVQIAASSYASGTTGMLIASSALVDTSHPDYVFSGIGSGLDGAFSVVDASQAHYRWAGALADPQDSIADGAVPAYLGQLDVTVPGDASGTFTLTALAAGTFARDDAGSPGAIPVDATTAQLLLNVIDSCACDSAANCVDLDADNAIDDVCTWGECTASPCGVCDVIQKAVPADISGPFGACTPDGFCNVHDRNQALSCFSGASSCESINIDAGGPFGACAPDGFCNIHDANTALACFAGTSSCLCGPAPEGSNVLTVDHVDLRIVAPRRAMPGEFVDVVVETGSPIRALQAYQLHLLASGGRRGMLTMDHIEIEDRKSAALPAGALRFEAANTTTQQMLAGLDGDDRAVPAKSYLATFVYRVSSDAAGAFVIDVLHDEAHQHQTYFVAPNDNRIEVNYVTSARIDIGRVSSRSRR